VIRERVEDRAVISGVGASAMGRRLGRDPWRLTSDACLAAIADAGLSPDDIDGVSTYPGATWGTPGITGAGVDDVRAMLGLRLRWYAGGGEMTSQLGSVINAVIAVGSGLVDHVLCFRTVWESSAQEQIGSRTATIRSGIVREMHQWTSPYGVGYPTYGGLTMQRYLHDSGATREQLAWLPIVTRQHAARNPSAVYREPLTIDDYLSARMISDPLCIYDCDVPTDGSIAVVVSRAGGAAVDPTRAVHVEAIGARPGFDDCAEMMWARTALQPADVDIAQVYDGFSILAVRWLEALRLSPLHETAAFVDGGKRIALDGQLPLNTDGGQLSGGRMHGYGHLYEACRQLRGEASERQVDPRPEVAAVSAGAEAFVGCLLLTR
jgi:acetyl-CoA acetyltransferase